MYATCLFCHGDLGRNETVEHFPVGRRLAYDAAKGRLWVVCRRCERWNLTPLEERWEAIEDAERLFSATRLRTSTEHVGLARLRDGTDLVRIGAPQRPELAAWRYGDQFGRRRKRHFAMVGVGVIAVGAVLVGGPAIGIATGGLGSQSWNGYNLLRAVYLARKRVSVATSAGEIVRLPLFDVQKSELRFSGTGVRLVVPGAGRGTTPWWRYAGGKTREFTGDDVLPAARAILPHLNSAGGSVNDVAVAVRALEEVADPMTQLRHAAGVVKRSGPLGWTGKSQPSLKSLPAPTRLALEMSLHEESERRAMEGELHLLEAAWQEAEEIAKIADDMFLPPEVEERLRRMREGGRAAEPQE